MATKSDVTTKYGEKRSAIVHAASVLINETGVKATTLTKVARAIGLNATSVTYYFPRKDELIVTVYEETIALMKATAEAALAEDTVEKRIAKFVSLHVALRERIRRGERGLITALSEIRSLDQEYQDDLLLKYRAVVNDVRAFFGDPDAEATRALFSARAHILIEAILWWPVWSLRYSYLDFPRVEKKIVEILCHGIPAKSGDWAPLELGEGPWRSNSDMPVQQNDEFLRAATLMINERGYRGASVNRIAEALSVTKGSFYHHHDAKDDLVMECFQRSYDRLSKVQMAGLELEGSYWTRLSSVLNELIDVQFFDAMPLLRTTALQALDSAHKTDVVMRSNRLARRFAGFLIDGIVDGSVKPVDPLVASQIIMSTLNGAYEARRWAARFDQPETAIKTYLSVLSRGMLADPD
ncbi:TetR/AcrR family transcriptional regulator [Pontixanthobacter aquaemixtae]|uniref:TetR family transcriptional regulator n=1 Tax=Pontixanthobacter aquaemixtae TaxID=1958940 RepID=A0A844ZSV8_9SPHN|nr:TetR/AcrR family transcriptional regulator [Pontixanthobacter aquaemixtae]MXO89887.1 TetR family transcriptional regulator [Pontixanthobacter aquaemixtae]